MLFYQLWKTNSIRFFLYILLGKDGQLLPKKKCTKYCGFNPIPSCHFVLYLISKQGKKEAGCLFLSECFWSIDFSVQNLSPICLYPVIEGVDNRRTYKNKNSSVDKYISRFDHYSFHNPKKIFATFLVFLYFFLIKKKIKVKSVLIYRV